MTIITDEMMLKAQAEHENKLNQISALMEACRNVLDKTPGNIYAQLQLTQLTQTLNTLRNDPEYQLIKLQYLLQTTIALKDQYDAQLAFRSGDMAIISNINDTDQTIKALKEQIDVYKDIIYLATGIDHATPKQKPQHNSVRRSIMPHEDAFDSEIEDMIGNAPDLFIERPKIR